MVKPGHSCRAIYVGEFKNHFELHDSLMQFESDTVPVGRSSDRPHYISLRCGICGNIESLPIVGRGKEPMWAFSNVGSTPTLSPSVRSIMGDETKKEFGWSVCHFTIIAGEFKALEDSVLWTKTK